MDSSLLKEYLKKLFNLEVAVYTQEKIIDNYSRDREKNKPKQKSILKISPPQKPDRSYFDNLDISFIEIDKIIKENKIYKDKFYNKLKRYTLYAWGGYLSVCFFPDEFILDKYGLGWLYFLPFLNLVYWYVRFFKIIPELKNMYRNDMYENAQKEYEDKYSKYLIKKEENDKLNEYNSNTYQQELTTYNKETVETMENHKKNLSELKNSLKNMYDLNILYEKYRNIVAVSTMYEYFESGRCDALEGPNGAYNMYESEVRQNIVVNSLSRIVSNIQEMKDNQFALCQQLEIANDTTNDILYEMSTLGSGDNTTQYFSDSQKLIEASNAYYATLFNK